MGGSGEGTADGCSCRVLGVLGMEVGGGLVYGPVISPKSFGGTLFLPDDLFRCFLHADSSTYPYNNKKKDKTPHN